MIIAQAKRHGVPEKLVRRIVMRESRYNPRARNHAYWGLMQISYPTAKSMGFKGTPEELLNPLVNLTYAVPYLANAFVIAGKEEDAAVRLYAAGYYFTARSRGLLNALRTADSTPVHGSGQPADQPPIIATAYATTPTSVTPIALAAATPSPASTMGRGSDGGVTMVASKDGELSPPKKWLHDGGTTTIVRGEQRIEQVAAYAKANGTETNEVSRSRAHARKAVAFASLDTPAEAQAYAAAAQDHRLAQSDSQTAIAQVTSGRPAIAESPAAEADPAPKKHARSARKRATPPDETKIAKSETAPSETAKSETASSETAPGDASDETPTRGRHKKHTASHKKAQAVALRQQADEPAPQPEQQP